MERRLKQYRTCVDPALDVFKSQYPPDLGGSMFLVFFDLQFYKMFFWGMGFPGELLAADQMLHFSFMTQQFRRKAEEIKNQNETTTEGEMITNLEPMSYHLKILTQEYMSESREMCELLLDGGFKCKFSSQLCSSYEYGQDTLEFLSLVHQNLAFAESIIHELVPLWGEQIAVIQLRLQLFKKILFVLNNWPHRSIRTVELIYHVQAWASHISHFTFLYWSYCRISGCLATSQEDDLSYVMWKSVYPRLIELSLDVFKGNRSRKGQATMSPQLLPDYVDFLLELVAKNDLQDGEITHNELETIREGLMFLLSFIMCSPNQESIDSELIQAEINSIIGEVPSVICAQQKGKLCKLLFKIDGVKTKIRGLYVVTPISSQFISPRTNAIGFLDSLLETLQNLLKGGANFIPSVKEQVIKVHEELPFFRPFLQYDNELQNEDNIFKDIQTQIVNVLHYAAYVTKLCTSTSSSIWYAIMCLPNVIQQIKLVKFEVEQIKDSHMYINKKPTNDINPIDALTPRATTSTNERAFVGFRKDVKSILDNLQGGRKDLTIISITGMPGQGKTTLARKIYDDPSIPYYFHKFAWCSVTKECRIKKLLADLLRSDKDGKDYGNLEIHDLGDNVRKSLKGRRYFIVLDDIWDVDVWRQVQYSFPDERNGSRILFTSRNHDLASKCKPDSISHHLQLFSDEESWELMKVKLACGEGFSQELSEVGKQIAVYCRGLPLAVVLIVSHLQRTRQELDFWMEVAENLKSHLANDGCMHILELSYKYLPRHLKLCFLYFGAAFRRGENIHAGKLIRLWIAEGFIKKNEMQSPEDLAREYLDDLVSQNLVHVIRRGSMGNINICSVHDLLYDLCIQKALEDNFLHLADYRTVQDESRQACFQKYNFHRHWLCIRDRDPTFTQLTPNSTQKELVPTSQFHSVFWSHRDILPIQCKSLSSFFNEFGALTVLDMMDVNLKGSTIPARMFLMSNIHMRYLGLRGDSFSRLLSPTPDFWNLETLILISDDTALSVPKSLWEIKSLSYVRIEKCFLDFDEYGHYVSTATASNIESLKGIIVRYNDKTLDVLRSLPKLRDLKCYYEECHPEFLFMFGSLEYLESLTIISFEEVIPRGFLFSNHGFCLPDTLKKLSLWGLRLPWKVMSTIGKLSHLEVLKLVANACKGRTWNLQDGEFSKLKCLRLFRLNVERIDDSACDNHPFPCLEKLELMSCDALEEVPASFGDICTLKEIYLCASPKALGSVEAICEQQREIGNQDLQIVVRDLPPIVLDDDIDDQGGKEEFQKNSGEEAEML